MSSPASASQSARRPSRPLGVPKLPSACGVGPWPRSIFCQPRSRRRSSETPPGSEASSCASRSSSVSARAGSIEAHARGKQPERLGGRLRLAERLDRGLVEGEVVMAPREERVEVLELRRRRQDHVGVPGGVGHELLDHEREQVLAAQAGQHALLLGRDLGRVRRPDDERCDRRLEVRVGERVAELRHVDPPHLGGAQLGPVDGRARDRAGGRGRDIGAAAAAVAPGADQGRQAGDRPIGDRSAEMALGADPEPQQRRLGAAEVARDPDDPLGGHAAELGPVLDRVLGEPLEQLVVAVGMGPAPLLVGELGIDDGAHHPQRQRSVGPRQRSQVLVGDPGGAAAKRVDHAQPSPVAARVEDLPPQVRRRRHRVPAPDQHITRVGPVLGVDLRRYAVGRGHAGDPGAGADRPHQLGGADRVHEPVCDRATLDRPLGAHVAVREDRLGAVRGDRLAQSRRGEVERLVPARRGGTRPRPWRRRGPAAAGSARSE